MEPVCQQTTINITANDGIFVGMASVPITIVCRDGSLDITNCPAGDTPLQITNLDAGGTFSATDRIPAVLAPQLQIEGGSP